MVRLAQGGQSLIALAALLPLVLIPLVMYTVEASLLATRQARLSSALAQAAEDAAQQVDSLHYRETGEIRLRADQVRAVAAASLRASDPGAELEAATIVGQGSVGLSAHERVPLQVAFLWPGAVVILHASSRARIRPGYDP